MLKSKNDLQSFLYMIFAAIFLWMALTSAIQRFKCDSLTETQLLKRIPYSFVLDFKNCEDKK